MKRIYPLICFCLLLQPLAAQQDLFQKKTLISGTDTLQYRILYPEKYKKRKSYPLIVFLHGSGERGRDNEAQLTHGAKLFLREDIRKHFPAIVIFPQCPKDSSWAKYRRSNSSAGRELVSGETAPVPQQLVKKLVDSLIADRKADERRIYLGGLSMGGFGTYDLLTRYPDFFTAAFPICGIANIPLFLERSTQVPLWIFHGGADNVVPPNADRDLFKAMMTRGVKTVMYTEYPTAGHNSWDSAFAEPQLLPWLFTQKKKLKDLSR